jgi:pSer/pThr/pTyr-binding forkhead associated (FHA) protein/Mg-chelatase subunit ChlD
MSDAVLFARVLVERTTMRPRASEDLHVVVDLTARGSPVESKRPRLSVMFCIDASTSMTGEPLAQVIASVGMIIDLLDDNDEVGLVAFASEASLISELSTLTPASRAMLRRRTAMIKPSGNTNIEAGLETAFRAFPARADDVRQVLVMLSDGEPNRGMTSVEQLAGLVDRARAQVGLVTLGYGSNHNSTILHGVAKAGGGQYWFIPEPSEAQSEFARALGAQGDIVSEQNEVALMPAEGVEIVEVLNVEKTRFTRDGLLVPVPDLRDGQNHKIVARLRVTAPPDNGPFPPVNVLVRHRPVGTKAVVDERLVPTFGIADRDATDVVEALHAVLLAQAEQTRAKARAEADIGRFDGAARLLRAVLERLQKAPGYVVNDGSPLSEAVEQLVDEVTAYERKPSAKEYMEFKATALGVDVAQGAKHAADVVGQSRIAVRMQQATTSAASVGTLVIVDQQGHEQGRVPLAGELIIGRVPGNDIVLPRGNISKRHARVVVRDGKAIVVDLKTTNGTYVNGMRVQSPVVLSPNDKIIVGEFAMRFDPLVGAPSTSAAPPSLAPAQPVTPPPRSLSVDTGVPAPVPTGASPGVFLVLNHEKEVTERVELPGNGEMTIGRHREVAIVIENRSVAREHARVVVRDGKVILVDLKSQNGTFVNDQRIASPRILRFGDVVKVGACLLEFAPSSTTLSTKGEPTDHARPKEPTHQVTGPVTPAAIPSALSSSGAFLEVHVNGADPWRCVLPASADTVIGCGMGSDVIVKSRAVARRHARITTSDGRVIIEDLMSAGGTFVNGVRVAGPRLLVEGDRVYLGDVTLQLCFDRHTT